MPEGAAEGQPHPIHKPEAKHTTEAQHTIDSAATPRQQPIETDQSREARQARINDLRQRIHHSVQDSERLLEDAIKFPDLSQPTPSKNKEQKKTGIRGLVSRGYERAKGLVGRGKSTEPPQQK
jgi:hypothetical protein